VVLLLILHYLSFQEEKALTTVGKSIYQMTTQVSAKLNALRWHESEGDKGYFNRSKYDINYFKEGARIDAALA